MIGPVPVISAFTFVELLVVLCLLLLLAAVLLPVNRPTSAVRIHCVSNLKQIGLAVKVWALDHNDRYPAQWFTNRWDPLYWPCQTNAGIHFGLISNELVEPRLLVCPADSKRKAATGFTNLTVSNLSYFVCLEARDTTPQLFLSGDRNLTNGLAPTNSVLYLPTNRPAAWNHQLHRFQGNVGLADGSVQQFTGRRLAAAVTNAEADSHLLLPAP